MLEPWEEEAVTGLLLAVAVVVVDVDEAQQLHLVFGS